MDSPRVEIEKIIEKIKSIELTYESLLSKTISSDEEKTSADSDIMVNPDFAAVKKEIEELKLMLNDDKN